MYTEGISILVAENMKREQKILTTKSKSVKQCFTRFRHGRSWCRGGSGGARDSQLFFGYVITGMFSKIHLDHHHHHHHHHYQGVIYNQDT